MDTGGAQADYDAHKMESALRVTTTVLPGTGGGRVEVISPQLREGDRVDVILLLPGQAKRSDRGVLEVLDSLPPGPRSAATWDEIERGLQEEREGWDK